MPPKFQFPDRAQLWVAMAPIERTSTRGARSLQAFGRMKPGVAQLKAIVDGGRLGTPILASARVRWHRPPEYYAASTWRGTQALETHCADAHAFLAQDIRAYDVIFLDPPFSEDHWAQLLPAAAARLATGGMLYVEAPVPIAAPEELTVWRHDKAGQVHYHLLRHSDRG